MSTCVSTVLEPKVLGTSRVEECQTCVLNRRVTQGRKYPSESKRRGKRSGNQEKPRKTKGQNQREKGTKRNQKGTQKGTKGAQGIPIISTRRTKGIPRCRTGALGILSKIGIPRIPVIPFSESPRISRVPITLFFVKHP